MPARLIDFVTPTAALLVSRAWVLREVEAIEGLDEASRVRLVDELTSYAPERRNGLRNSFIAWVLMLGGAMLARLLGVTPWLGFVAGFLIVLVLARLLAERALRWRLAQWLDAR